MTAFRVTAGGLLALTGALILLLAWAAAERVTCNDGLLDAGPENQFHLPSAGAAVVIRSGGIGTAGDDDYAARGCGRDYDRRRLTVLATPGNEKRLFAGVAASESVASYLGSVRHDRARLAFSDDGLSGSSRLRPTGSTDTSLLPPESFPRWREQGRPTGSLDPIPSSYQVNLSYGHPVDERFSLVLMNEDASPGVDTFAWVGVAATRAGRPGPMAIAIAAGAILSGLLVVAAALATARQDRASS